MLLWHWFFSYFHLTLQCGSAVSRGNERENANGFGLRGLSLSFYKGCFLSFAIWKCRAIWEGKTDLISHCTHYPRLLWRRENRGNTKIRVSFATIAFLLPPLRSFSGRQSTVEALPFALLVLTLNPKVFWCETCLLCVDVCFVYGLGFVHVVWSCFLVMPVHEKNGFLMCSGLMVSNLASFMVYGLFTWFALACWLCMYAKKRKMVSCCVSIFHPPMSSFYPCVCCKTTHSEPFRWTELIT